MSSAKVLIVGTNPNLMFYGWRLQHTGCVEVSVVNSKIERGQPVWFQSESLGNQQFQPDEMYEEISQIEEGQEFDIVIISAQSLQHFQSICNEVSPFVMDNSIILIESTGYVNLEPFIQISSSKDQDLAICSIMNESDVRETSGNGFIHSLRNGENRIYFGTCSDVDDIASHSNFQKVYKLLQIVQENSEGAISLLKSTVSKEFMTYQWKLALPRIIFNPLSIIFEAEFPEQLDEQILCKPLISGVLHEMFKIIKKMDCKLVKGYENETSLMKNWCAYYPSTSKNNDYVNSTPLFYKFYHRDELEIDLLLLQPILLADDHGIRTPYLENLYSTMCQFLRLNNKDSKSILFKRVDGSSQNDPKVAADYEYMSAKLGELTESIAKTKAEEQSLASKVKEKEFLKVELDAAIIKAQQKLDLLNTDVEHTHVQLEIERSRHERMIMDHEQKMYELKEAAQQQQKPDTPTSAPTINNEKELESSKSGAAQKVFSKSNPRESVQVTDNLEDLADIALYGATLNGETTGPQEVNRALASDFSNKATISTNRPDQNGAQQPQQQPQQQFGKPRTPTNGSQGSMHLANDELPIHLQEKELELQRREQALLNRELQASHDPQMSSYRPVDPSQVYATGHGMPNQRPYNYGQPGVPQYHPNGYNSNAPYYEGAQLPAHGYPQNGMPQAPVPPNMRSQRYQSNNYSSRSRVSSVPSMDLYQEGGIQSQPQPQPQYGYGPGYQAPHSNGPMAPPMHSSYQYGHNQYHSNSFSNAAPIDPMVEQRFKANPKKSNRRSGFPQMSGNLEGLDMGGRGGMPIPGSQPKTANGRSRSDLMNPGTSAGRKQSNGGAPVAAQGTGPGAQYTQVPPSQPSAQGQFLQRPSQMQSNSSNSSANSVNTYESSKTPATDGENGFTGIQLSVPQVESGKGIPNGDIKAATEAQKKKGGFRRK